MPNFIKSTWAYIAQRTWLSLTLAIAALFSAFLAGGAGLFVLGHKDDIKSYIKTEFVTKKANPYADQLYFEWSTIETGLLSMDRADIRLGDTVNITSGGAIDSIGSTVLYVSASGHIAMVDITDGEIKYSPVRVPMDFEQLQSGIFADQPTFNNRWYRVHDIMIQPDSTPDKATLYVSHHIFVPDSSEICVVISKTLLDTRNNDIQVASDDWEEIYRVRDCISMEEFDWHYFGLESGGTMLMLDDENMLMTVGDFGLQWELHAEDRVGRQYDNDYAKILKIHVDTGESEIYASGVRNAQGLIFDNEGRIWEAEHGPQGGDEINLIVRDADYGWPNVSLGMHYGRPRRPMHTNPVQGRHEGGVRPVMAFMPSIGISALATIPANPLAFELWEGDLLATSLRAQSLFHLRRHGDDLLYAEQIEMGTRLRDVHILDNGWIALLGGHDQTLILLKDVPANKKDVSEPVAIAGYTAVNALEADFLPKLGSTTEGRDLFRQNCARCHDVHGRQKIGPALDGVINRPVGTLENYAYSEELERAGGKWTKSKLNKFLKDPEIMYPDTTMYLDYYPLDSRKRKLIIDYLSDIE